jgi:hypothetical protein
VRHSRATGRMHAVQQIGHTPMPAAVPAFPARILFLQQRPPSPPSPPPTTSLASNARVTAVRTGHIRRTFVSSCARESRNLCEMWGMGGGTSVVLLLLAYGLPCQHGHCQLLLAQR